MRTMLVGDICRVALYPSGDIQFPAPFQIPLASVSSSAFKNGDKEIDPVCVWSISEEDDLPCLDKTPTLKLASSKQSCGTIYAGEIDCVLNDFLSNVRAQANVLDNGDDYDMVLYCSNPDCDDNTPYVRKVLRCAPNTFNPVMTDEVSAYGTFSVKIKMQSCGPLIDVTE